MLADSFKFAQSSFFGFYTKTYKAFMEGQQADDIFRRAKWLQFLLPHNYRCFWKFRQGHLPDCTSLSAGLIAGYITLINVAW